jgi:hypothetical protein
MSRLAFLVAFGLAFSGGVVHAKPITEAEKNHCAEAYRNYCSEYGLESAALRNCMSRNGRSLSDACIEALIDAGEVSRAEVQRRRRSGH